MSTFQINARTELALRYNDISPLENHHCAVAFEILEKVKKKRKKKTQLKTLPSQVPRHIWFWTRAKDKTLRIFCFFFQTESNIFRNLSVDQYKRIREGIIKWDRFTNSTECACCLILDTVQNSASLCSSCRCILATDMTRHNEILSKFKSILPSFDFTSKEHRDVVSRVRKLFCVACWRQEPSLRKVLKSSKLLLSFCIVFLFAADDDSHQSERHIQWGAAYGGGRALVGLPAAGVLQPGVSLYPFGALKRLTEVIHLSN